MADIPSLDIDPFTREVLIDPYPSHALLRNAAAVTYLPRYGIYAMARHAEVAATLRDWQRFTSARGLGLSDFSAETPWRPASLLLDTDPPEHDRTRALANKVVSLGSLRAVRAAWDAAAERLVDEVVAAGTFDGVTDLAEQFPQRVFADTIGLREDGRANLVPYATTALAAFFDAFMLRSAP